MQTLYASVSFSFLRKVEEATLSNDKEAVYNLGLDPEQADQISKMRAADVFKLARIYQLVNIEIDEELLKHSIEQAEQGITVQANIPDAELTGELLRNLSNEAMDSFNHELMTKEFGLSSDMLDTLATLSLSQISSIIKTGTVFYDISADEYRLPMALDFIAEQNREEESLSRLIEADASFPMVNALTGIHKKAFQLMRKKKGLMQTSASGGAPKQLDQEQAHIAYNAWVQSSGKPMIERCLAVHEAVNVGLRHLWPRIEEFRRYEEGEDVQLV